MRSLLLLLVGVAACSSFEAAPATPDDAGSSREDAGPALDAGAPTIDVDASDGSSIDAEAIEVYRNAFDSKTGWGSTHANLGLVTGRTGMALGVCGAGGNEKSGAFGMDAAKMIGTPGAGRYRVHAWVKHSDANAMPTLAIGMTVGSYEDVAATVVTTPSSTLPTSLPAMWIEVTQEVTLSGNGQYLAVALVAYPGSGTATGCFRVDDLTVERLPE